MPPSYNPIVTAIDILYCQATTNISLDVVKNKLLMEEERQCKNKNKEEGPQAFIGNGRNFRGRGRGNNTGMRNNNNPNNNEYNPRSNLNNNTGDFQFICYNCGRRGHKKFECRYNQNYNQGNPRNQQCNVTEDIEIAFLTSEDTALSTDTSTLKFIVDSGATNHLVNTHFGKYLTNVKQISHKIQVAKEGETIEAIKEGTLHLETNDGRNIKLGKVLLCNNLTHNLLSVKKIEQKGLQVLFKDGEVHIKKGEDKIIK